MKIKNIVLEVLGLIVYLKIAIIFIAGALIAGGLQILWPAMTAYEVVVIYLIAVIAARRALHIKKIDQNFAGLMGIMTIVYLGTATLILIINNKGVWLLITILAITAIFANLLYHANILEIKSKYSLKS